MLLLSSNWANPEAMDVYTYSVSDRKLRLAAKNPGIGILVDVSRNNKRMVLNRMQTRNDNNLYWLDLENALETLLTKHDGPSQFSGGIFSPDGSAIYLIADKDRDLSAFFQIKLSENDITGPMQLLAERADAELEGAALSDDGTTAALVWNHNGRSELDFLDLRSRQLTPGPRLPNELITETWFSVASFSRDARKLAITLTGFAATSDIWVLDRQTGKLNQVTHSPHAGVDLSSLVRSELVQFQAHDGLGLSGWLYRPRKTVQPGPMVLSFHGGPEGQERPFFRSDYQALLASGIAVFAPNVRGSTGFGKTFVNLDNGFLRTNAIKDIQSCVNHVVKAGLADPKRLGIMGASYGGYMVMAALAEYPELFAAGVDMCGIVNFETFFAHSEPWMAAISTIEYGDPKTQFDMLRNLSPIHRIDRVEAPTLVIHGANDTNVPVVEADQVVNSLKKRGVPVEYILFPDEGHGWVKTPNRIRANLAVVQWFAQHLKVAQP